MKFAPFRTSWAEIVRRGAFTLRGVRSPTARAHLAAMRLGDPVLFYHSQQELAVVGMMEVTREAYADATSSDPQWLTCDFMPIQTLARPVPLAEIKAAQALAGIPLLRRTRLAVMPLEASEFTTILGTQSPMTLWRRKRSVVPIAPWTSRFGSLAVLIRQRLDAPLAESWGPTGSGPVRIF